MGFGLLGRTWNSLALLFKTSLLSVFTNTRKEPKGTKTSQRSPGKKMQSDPLFQNWGNVEFSASFRFSNFKPKCSNLGIMDRKASTFESSDEILPVSYYDGADFKSSSGCFLNSQAKMPKCVHFGSIIITKQKF